MTPDLQPSSDPSPEEISDHIHWTEVFRSGFWRFYDHPLRCSLINFSWALTCFAIGKAYFWMGGSWHSEKFNPILALGFFLVETMASMGWAYSIFRLFVERTVKLSDVWRAYPKFGLRAFGISVVFWTGSIWTSFNGLYLWTHPMPSPFFNYILIGANLWMLFFFMSVGFFLWPVLFHQDLPIFKVFKKSILLVWDMGWLNFLFFFFFAVFALFFTVIWPLWFFVGLAFLFSIQCITLEKRLLKYRITFEGQDITELVKYLEFERNRNWREFLRPWENR